MAKPNYQHLKKQREAAKKREQQEKMARRQASRPVVEADPRKLP
jgi:hypothetical protein